MSSKARIFLAGGLTTLILAVGFGGLLLAQSASKPSTGYQSRVVAQSSPVRVILPASAEPAHPPQPSTVAMSASESQPQLQPARQVQTSAERQVENADTRKAKAAEQRRERRKQDAQRKSKMMAAQARQQMERMGQRPATGILAFGSNEPGRGVFPGN
jgi:type IV secretory pathway VirB10-like protein